MSGGRAALWQAFGIPTTILLPPRCLSCGERVKTPKSLCAPCWAAMPMIERPYCERLGTPFDHDAGEGLLSPEAIAHPPRYGRARVACRYEGPAVALVQGLKYADHIEHAALLGRLMARAGREVLVDADAILPVPLHRVRLWQRRFNQSALLAKIVAQESGVPLELFALTRDRATSHQVGLSRKARLSNVQGAFAVRDAARPLIEGKRLILVDDVITTGATIDAATAVLARAGAANVDVLAFARVCIGT